jgi:hypothetical protein
MIFHPPSCVERQREIQIEDKNISKNADLSDSDLLLPLPISPSSQIKLPSAHTSISLDPNKDLNFDIIEKQFEFEKPSRLLSLDVGNRNEKLIQRYPKYQLN